MVRKTYMLTLLHNIMVISGIVRDLYSATYIVRCPEGQRSGWVKFPARNDPEARKKADIECRVVSDDNPGMIVYLGGLRNVTRDYELGIEPDVTPEKEIVLSK